MEENRKWYKDPVVLIPVLILLLVKTYFFEYIFSQTKALFLNEPAFVCLDTVCFYKDSEEGYPTSESDDFDEKNRTKIIINERITKESYSFLFGNSYNSNDFKIYCNNQEAATEITTDFSGSRPLEALYLKYNFKSKLFLHHGINKIIVKNRDKEEIYYIKVLKE